LSRARSASSSARSSSDCRRARCSASHVDAQVLALRRDPLERIGEHRVPSRLSNEVRQRRDLDRLHRHRVTALQRAQHLGVAGTDHHGHPLAEVVVQQRSGDGRARETRAALTHEADDRAQAGGDGLRAQVVQGIGGHRHHPLAHALRQGGDRSRVRTGDRSHLLPVDIAVGIAHGRSRRSTEFASDRMSLLHRG
jgi:hypothetical protein